MGEQFELYKLYVSLKGVKDFLVFLSYYKTTI